MACCGRSRSSAPTWRPPVSVQNIQVPVQNLSSAGDSNVCPNCSSPMNSSSTYTISGQTYVNLICTKCGKYISRTI